MSRIDIYAIKRRMAERDWYSNTQPCTDPKAHYLRALADDVPDLVAALEFSQQHVQDLIKAIDKDHHTVFGGPRLDGHFHCEICPIIERDQFVKRFPIMDCGKDLGGGERCVLVGGHSSPCSRFQ